LKRQTPLSAVEENSFDVSCISFALHDMLLNVREKVLQEMVQSPNQMAIRRS
jgi:hypothetical protein